MGTPSTEKTTPLQTITLRVAPGVPPPTGNGFKITPRTTWGRDGSNWNISTGLYLEIPDGYKLEFDGMPNVYVLSHKFAPDGELTLLVQGRTEDVYYKPVATAWIVKREPARIRFAQQAPQGGRIIRGEAKPVEDCD